MELNIHSIIEKAKNGQSLTKEDAVSLLNVKNNSEELSRIFALANKLTKKAFNNKGYVFAQIGINAQPCSINCKFCSMGANHYVMESEWCKDAATVLSEVSDLVNANVDDIFLMTTADYSIQEFINLAKNARKIIPQKIKLVANIGDFDLSVAYSLKEAGVTGIYHIHRLKEGIDTNVEPKVRIKTLDAIKEAGLELYYCVEPIGPEHTYEEIADEMERGRDYDVNVMAVMRRTPVGGTPLFDKGQISALELTKIAAVTRLVSEPTRAMNAHEVTPATLIARVNQLYAEYGANPRDDKSNTETGRGYSTDTIKKLLTDFEYELN
jgi:biotin synthase